MKPRRITRNFKLGTMGVGSDYPVSIQTMTKTDTHDVPATIAQIREIATAGADVVRLAVVDIEAAQALAPIKKASPIPIIADIHFQYKQALEAIESGVDGLRLNPGNIGARWKVEEVVKACKERDIPIRIGVNSGSIDKELLRKHGGPTVEAMVESAMDHVRILEELDFRDVKVSLKATNVDRFIESNRRFAEITDIPIHLGVTEAGTVWSGTIKSTAGLAVLLAEGVGDTLRVSLTGNPVEEVRVGWQILKSMGLRDRGIEIISCPTCGRLEIPIEQMCHDFEQALSHIEQPFHLSVMGCAVNGPGEGVEADIGVVAHHRAEMQLFKDGKFWRRASYEETIPIVVEEFNRKVAELRETGEDKTTVQ